MTIFEDLAALRLFYLHGNFEQFLVQMNSEQAEPRKVLEKTIELETIEKRNRSIERRIRAAKFGRFKQMANFDYSWPTSIDKNQITDILTAGFVDSQENIVLAGPQGVGKTMIAKNIGWQAVMNGKSVLCTTASDLVIDLGSQESTAALQRRLRAYLNPDLLIVDELGYLSFDNASADLLFEIVSKRYEKGSIILTTNLAFKDWPTIFPGAACITALIDRLTHHCRILKIDGPSFRAADSKSKQAGRKKK